MSAYSISFSSLNALPCHSNKQRSNAFPCYRVMAPAFTRPLIVEAKSRTRQDDRIARHSRLRKKVEGTPERPRMAVFRSNKHIFVQVIDDTQMHTLAAVSTMQKAISAEVNYSSGPTILQLIRCTMIGSSTESGEAIAKSCLEKGITKVAFDRGGYPYHGRIQAIAEAAREKGLQF